jgi:hypothetical protein
MVGLYGEAFQENRFSRTVSREAFQKKRFSRSVSREAFQEKRFSRSVSVEAFQETRFKNKCESDTDECARNALIIETVLLKRFH